jgi:hypothetical protein
MIVVAIGRPKLPMLHFIQLYFAFMTFRVVGGAEI